MVIFQKEKNDVIRIGHLDITNKAAFFLLRKEFNKELVSDFVLKLIDEIVKHPTAYFGFEAIFEEDPYTLCQIIYGISTRNISEDAYKDYLKNKHYYFWVLKRLRENAGLYMNEYATFPAKEVVRNGKIYIPDTKIVLDEPEPMYNHELFELTLRNPKLRN